MLLIDFMREEGLDDATMTLRERGYCPVPVSGPDMNVASAGKRPVMSKWQVRCLDASAADIERWPRTEPGSTNTGLLTGSLAGADIDILRADLAAAVEARAVLCLGPTPLRRIGRAPKVLLCYRLALPIDKLQTPSLFFTEDPDEKPTKVEILLRGQQFAAFGTHPETREPYTWPDASPLTVDFVDVPEVTEGALRQFLAEAEEMIREAGGRTRAEQKGAERKRESEGRRAAGMRIGDGPPDRDTVADALRAIPNDLDYDEWVRVGFALHAATGGTGQDLWEAWSAGSPKNDPRLTAGKWRTFGQGRTISPATLFWFAKEAGWRRPTAQRRAARGARDASSDGPAASEVPPEAGEDTRPLIRIAGGFMPSIVTRAERALIDGEAGFYQRGGLMVRPAMSAIPVADGGKVQGVRLVQVKSAHVAEVMTRLARFERYDGRAEDWVPIDCPPRVAETYLARDGLWKLPILAGVVNCPVPRPDGSILDVPGYDVTTGLLYDPQGATFDPIRGDPNRDSALAALNYLKRIISTFPFVSPTDRAVALSGILTAVARRALPTAPLHGFDAPTAGTGKSLLVDIASMILDGRRAAVMSMGKTPEEAEKRLGAALLLGDAVISADNCETPVGGELFCQCLTQPSVKLRPLGLSQLVEAPTNAAMFATGNNLTFIGDMTRRALRARLDAGVERPETREFDVKPLEEIARHRARFVRAVLTILRAFHVAGRPRQATPLGSFEVWSDWVRGALLWLGEPDPCETMKGLRDADPKLAQFKAVVSQWHDVIGETRVSAKEVIERAVQPDEPAPDYDTGYPSRSPRGPKAFRHAEFREALLAVAGEGGNISSLRLGRWLGNNKDRITASAAALDAAALKIAGGSALPGAGAAAGAAAPAAGVTLGAGGAAIAGGAAAGAYLDWNFGGNPGAIGALTGQESDHQKSMRYLRERQAARAATAGIGYGTGGGRTMGLPAGIGGGGSKAGYASEYDVSRGAVGDFLWGKGKGSMSLPGFGSSAPKMDTSQIDEAKKKVDDLSGTTIAPKADASSLTVLGDSLDTAKTKGAELGAMTIRPNVDGSSVGTIIQQLQTAIGLAGQLGSTLDANAAKARANVGLGAGAAAGGRTGAVKSAMSGAFSDQGMG